MKPTRPNRILDVVLSSQANKSVREYANLIADTLILNSKTKAAAKGQTHAEASEVRESYQEIVARYQAPGAVRMALNTLALVVFGAAIQALYSEYTAAGRKDVLVTCFATAFITFVIWSFTHFRK